MAALHYATAIAVCLAQLLQHVAGADGTFDLSLKDSAPVCVGKICKPS